MDEGRINSGSVELLRLARPRPLTHVTRCDRSRRGGGSGRVGSRDQERSREGGRYTQRGKKKKKKKEKKERKKER